MASCDNDIIADQPGLAQVESEDSMPAESPAFIAAARIGVHRRVGTSISCLCWCSLLTTGSRYSYSTVLVVREYEYFTLVLVLVP